MNRKRATKTDSFISLLIIAWRNIWRNRRRTSLCIAAVGIAVFFIIIMESWIDGMVIGMEEIIATYDTGHVNVVSQGYEADREYYPVQFPLEGVSEEAVVKQVESLDHVDAAFPRIMAYSTLFDSTVKHALLWGIDIERETAYHYLNITEKSDGIIEGRYPDPDNNECAIGREMAKKAGLKIGDTVPLKVVSAQFSDKYWKPVITGIFEFDYQKFDEETIVVPIQRLKRILGLGDGVQQLIVFADRSKNSPVIRNQLKSLLDEDAIVREWTENYWVAMFRSMSGVYVIIFGVFQIVASFLIINTMLMVIHERIKEIGMMGALGMKRIEIVTLFFLEAVILSILGAFAGVLVGALATGVGSLFPIDMNAMTGGGMKDFPISGTLYLVFSFPILVKGFLFGVFITSICTLLPSLKSAFIQPVEALRR